LSICKEALEAYGGSISIHSSQCTIHNDGGGSGTVVTFALPIYKEESGEWKN